MSALQGLTIPRPLISQHLGHLEPMVACGSLAPQADAIVLGSVTRVLDIYADAINSAQR
jgi:D-tagatose-1,6-bisphosphate aldolase subunit GatZ/KbaZ